MTPQLWFAAFVAVNLLDAALTLWALRQGAAEANPLIRALMRRLHPALALALVKGALIAAVAVWLADVAPWLPLLTGDEEGRADAREAIQRFNEKNPKVRINPVQMAQSVRSRLARVQQSDAGVFLPRNRRSMAEVGRFAESE